MRGPVALLAMSLAATPAWAQEDVYVPLPQELELLRDAGFIPEVVWRQGVFAVIAARAQ